MAELYAQIVVFSLVMGWGTHGMFGGIFLPPLSFILHA